MTTSSIALGAGYLLSVPFSIYVPGFLRLWRRREPLVLAAEELGVALVVTGWALKGNAPAVVFNTAWGVGLAVAYGMEGRKRSRLGR